MADYVLSVTQRRILLAYAESKPLPPILYVGEFEDLIKYDYIKEDPDLGWAEQGIVHRITRKGIDAIGFVFPYGGEEAYERDRNEFPPSGEEG